MWLQSSICGGGGCGGGGDGTHSIEIHPKHDTNKTKHIMKISHIDVNISRYR